MLTACKIIGGRKSASIQGRFDLDPVIHAVNFVDDRTPCGMTTGYNWWMYWGGTMEPTCKKCLALTPKPQPQEIGGKG